MTGNPWLSRRIFNWAHQGGACEGPSNTLFAMHRGLDNGAAGLELDVHKTRDGHLVVCHDTTLDRTTNGRGRIARKTLAKIKELDSAYWWVEGKVDDHDPATPPEKYIYRGRAASDPQFRIPTLAEVLEEFPGVPMNLELKLPGYEGFLARFLLANPPRPSIVVAFRDGTIHKFTESAPHIDTAAGRWYSLVFWLLAKLRLTGLTHRRSKHRAVQVPDRMWGISLLDRGFVEAAHDAGLAVHVWTINDAPTVERLIDLGVDGFMTDRPSLVAEVLRRRAVAFDQNEAATPPR
ncbi:MAG: glycerophosphodiester phosphodiesterase [Actinomycetota bacterium]